MGCDECIIELIKTKLLTSLTMLIVHAVNSLSATLVESEKERWGLYKWCSVEEGNITQCYKIHPGESPAYVEVARFSAAFSVVMIFLNFPIILWFPSDHSICKWLLKVVITLLPSLNVGTTLVLVAAYCKDDDHWQDSNPSLTRSFHCIVFVAVLDLVLTCFFFFFHACSLGVVIIEQQICCQMLSSGQIKASLLWKYLCRKRVTVMERLKASIFGKRLSRKLVITMKRLGPGTAQDLPDNPLRHQPGQPGGHGSPPIRHAPGGPVGDLPPGIDQNNASDTSSVTARHSEGAARYNAADAHRSGGTTIHQTAGQGEVRRYSTMDFVIYQDTLQGEVGTYTRMDFDIHEPPIVGEGQWSRTSGSILLQGARPDHSFRGPRLALADFRKFVGPRTNIMTFHLRRPRQTGEDTPTRT